MSNLALLRTDSYTITSFFYCYEVHVSAVNKEHYPLKFKLLNKVNKQNPYFTSCCQLIT